MHTAITKAFKRYNLFGFTGTPIFAENAGSGGPVTYHDPGQTPQLVVLAGEEGFEPSIS